MGMGARAPPRRDHDFDFPGSGRPHSAGSGRAHLGGAWMQHPTTGTVKTTSNGDLMTVWKVTHELKLPLEDVRIAAKTFREFATFTEGEGKLLEGQLCKEEFEKCVAVFVAHSISRPCANPTEIAQTRIRHGGPTMGRPAAAAQVLPEITAGVAMECNAAEGFVPKRSELIQHVEQGRRARCRGLRSDPGDGAMAGGSVDLGATTPRANYADGFKQRVERHLEGGFESGTRAGAPVDVVESADPEAFAKQMDDIRHEILGIIVQQTLARAQSLQAGAVDLARPATCDRPPDPRLFGISCACPRRWTKCGAPSQHGLRLEDASVGQSSTKLHGQSPGSSITFSCLVVLLGLLAPFDWLKHRSSLEVPGDASAQPLPLEAVAQLGIDFNAVTATFRQQLQGVDTSAWHSSTNAFRYGLVYSGYEIADHKYDDDRCEHWPSIPACPPIGYLSVIAECGCLAELNTWHRRYRTGLFQITLRWLYDLPPLLHLREKRLKVILQRCTDCANLDEMEMSDALLRLKELMHMAASMARGELDYQTTSNFMRRACGRAGPSLEPWIAQAAAAGVKRMQAGSQVVEREPAALAAHIRDYWQPVFSETTASEQAIQEH
ncbi:unnamed protein product [Prorocentrum cordatum]|uniref:Uncharacterized protein n=1 Tax=Prorocentrum cordatum TaxID=2364126 RepID=A0ABN9X3D2_9DINO|nr:unnamed protein product [Polarella glacialis]